MSQFVMLLWETPATFASASPADIQAIIGEYVAWRKAMGAAGKLKGGQKLRDEGGKHLAGKTVTDGPYVETNEIIGGFFLIEAADYAEAVEISRSCPHLKFGRIELREIEIT
jgi:hypothetical protein